MHIGHCDHNICMLEFQLQQISRDSLLSLLAAVLNELRAKTYHQQTNYSDQDFNDDATYKRLVLEMLELHSTVKRAFSLAVPHVEESNAQVSACMEHCFFGYYH